MPCCLYGKHGMSCRVSGIRRCAVLTVLLKLVKTSAARSMNIDTCSDEDSSCPYLQANQLKFTKCRLLSSIQRMIRAASSTVSKDTGGSASHLDCQCRQTTQREHTRILPKVCVTKHSCTAQFEVSNQTCCLSKPFCQASHPRRISMLMKEKARTITAPRIQAIMMPALPRLASCWLTLYTCTTPCQRCVNSQ